jgi:hypothetical protein
MAKMQLLVELDVIDEGRYYQAGRLLDTFYEDLCSGGLVLHSDSLGRTLGTVKVRVTAHEEPKDDNTLD